MCGQTAGQREQSARKSIRRVTASQRQDRRFLPSRRHFREQQCVVEGIDDTGKGDAAFLAFEAIALESASVDAGHAVASKRQTCTAGRASNDWRRRHAQFLQIRRWTIVLHRDRLLR